MLNQKPPTIESLMRKCNKEYTTFVSYLSKAHYESYFQIKLGLRNDMKQMFHAISTCNDEPTTLKLLEHFKEQLVFINKHPFSANEKEYEEFLVKNYPYQEKIDAIINRPKTDKKLKM